MKISLKWLQDWVDVSDFLNNPAPLVALLTDKGLEVESVEQQARALEGVVVGEIVKCEPHPDAQKLKVTHVATGEGRLHQIVCGAPNCERGIRVPVALPGAVLPGDLAIKSATLRGVESHGMLCSSRELALSEDHAGLMILDLQAPLGQPVAKYLGLDDVILELKVTPNRADCLSHVGLAREISCLLGRPIKTQQSKFDVSRRKSGSAVDVRVESVEGCPLYMAQAIEGVRIGPSPEWLQNRLKAVGLRPINNVVDVTNYVMMEWGQPLHAFDLDRLRGHQLVVSDARASETFETLFGQKLELESRDLTIRDGEGPVALAGVIGGLNSGIHDGTGRVVLESAVFSPLRVRRTARRLGLQSDASYRFARGVNPDTTADALHRATELLVEVAGGEAVGDPVVQDHRKPSDVQISISSQLIQDRLGYPVDFPALENLLKQLGCEIYGSTGGALTVIPPRHRPDLEMDMDLVEEVARLQGYDKIPETLPVTIGSGLADSESYRKERVIRRILTGAGYRQAVNFGFTSSRWQRGLLGDDGRRAVAGLSLESGPVGLRNPLSEDLDVMRQSLLPGILKNVEHNFHQGQTYGRLYEFGSVFEKVGEDFREPARLVLALWGQPRDLWGSRSCHGREMPLVFELKSHLQTLFHQLGITLSFETLEGEEPWMHPFQCARIRWGDEVLGVLSTLHPEVAEELKLRVPVAMAELSGEGWGSSSREVLRGFKAFSRYPAVERDAALVIPESLPASSVLDFVSQQLGQVLESSRIWDQFQGGDLKPGERSITLGFVLRKMDGTFDEGEAQTLVDGALNAACQKFQIRIR